MKNINVEYDMDENDLDIILREITKDNKKKPTLAYIFENYTNLLSVFKPHVIKKVLDTIEEGYEYAPNEGEETEDKKKKKKDEFEDEPHDIESDPESMKEESSFGNAYDRIMGQLNEAHVPEGDDEGRMLESQLRTIRDDIDQLLPMIKPNHQFEAWVQSKVTLAKDYVSAVRDYLTQHYAEYHSEDDGDRGSHDLSDDAEALASAGHGTDEDYGYYGGNEDNEEVKEGVVEEKKGSRCTKVTKKASSTRPGKKWMKCVRQGGSLKRIHWGQAGVRVTGKSGWTKRRKSFRARHKCSSAKPGTPRYQACKDW